MNLTKKLSVMGLLALTLTAAACSFNVSTASIGGLKMGKDRELSQETTTFEVTDTISSAVAISMNPGTVKVKGSLHVIEIEGQKPGLIPATETTTNVGGEGSAKFHFSPPTKGWPKGKYKFEAQMLNEDGEQKDSKSQDFTVN
jgi:hypothetical protein